MDIEKTLSELREERDQIDRAILSLERLAKGRGRTGGHVSSLDRRPTRQAARTPTWQQAQTQTADL
jgi:hypothetical protein